MYNWFACLTQSPMRWLRAPASVFQSMVCSWWDGSCSDSESQFCKRSEGFCFVPNFSAHEKCSRKEKLHHPSYLSVSASYAYLSDLSWSLLCPSRLPVGFYMLGSRYIWVQLNDGLTEYLRPAIFYALDRRKWNSLRTRGWVNWQLQRNPLSCFAFAMGSWRLTFGTDK